MTSLPQINFNHREYSFPSKTSKYRRVLSRFAWLPLVPAMLFGSAASQAQTVTANFANRSGSTPAIPSGLLGVGGTGSTVTAQGPVSTITSAGLNQTRFWILLQQVYATSTPNFGVLDSQMKVMSAAGLHPIAVIVNTPPSLGSSTCSAPSDVNKWGQMAASVVAHLDQNFPGVVQDYEIWNEPELSTSLCVTDATARLNTYVSMFQSAASAMHAQAKADGQTIRTGGPVISQMSQASTWLPALLNNSSTAPYVDFVSFHLYITGQTDINNGMTWPGLYSVTQSSTQGLIHYYKLIEPLVRAGKQPNAASTPIYLSEYNSNWAYAVDHLRNDPTYGPLWNSLAITDFLNVVYNGTTAVPSKLNYFNSVGSYFCLLGQWDADMDCNTSRTDPYPQYYAFHLFASPNYLNLQAGGHMAASVTPASTTSGLSATAFYNDAADNVVIVNPTSTSYKAVTVTLANPGMTSVTGTSYLLNSSNSQISTESTALTPVSGGYTATIAVPAYSTVAVSMTGRTAPAPAPSPVAPTPVLNVTPKSGTHPLVASIDASASQNGGSPITGETIAFGDGTWVNMTPTTTHTYTKTGSYTVKLTLKNQAGLTATASSVVTVN